MKKSEREEILNTVNWLSAILSIVPPKITFSTQESEDGHAMKTDTEKGTIKVFQIDNADFLSMLSVVLFGLRIIWQERVCPLVHKDYKEKDDCEGDDEYFSQEAVIDAAAFAFAYIKVAYKIISTIKDVEYETAQRVVVRSEIYAEWLKKACIWIRDEDEEPTVNDF